MANSDKNIRITPNKGTTSFPKIVFTGQANDPITVNVLDDNSLSFSGSAGQLFSLSNNISSGTIFSVNDISGFPSFRINANGTISTNEFSGNFGIGISNPYYKLQIIGTLGVSGGVALTAGIASTSSSSGTLVVTGGAAIGSSLSIGGSLLLWNGANYSALKYTGSNNITYTLPTALPGTGTSVLSSDTSGVLSWVPMTASGVGGGGAGTVYNSGANLLAYYPSAGSAVTGNTSLSASGTGLTIGFTTSSTGTTTGALTVAGGVGIGGSLNVNSASSISGVNFNNGIITSGTWSGTTITAYYGGTGYTNYTKGDLLVGLGTTLYKLPVGTQGQLLQAFSTATAGVAWTSIQPPTYGAFYSTTSQTVAGAGITTPLTLNATFEAYNTQILGGSGTSSRIQIQTAGTYNIQFSAQINVTTGASSSIGDFWFRINGLDVPKSNTEMSIAGNNQQTVLSLNFVSSFAANDYFELVMSSSDTHYQIEAKSALTSPPRPDIPSLIITVVPVTQVVGSSAGIGVSGLVSLNGLNQYIQYFATGQSGSDFNISSSGFTHTFNIPIAGTASTGLITSQAQTIGGAKTFTSPIIGNLTGTATTANYSHQAGYAITSGSSALATTATYAHQSGYGITAGSSATATTATYSHQAGYAITSGSSALATTSTYAHQSGYSITSGSSGFWITPRTLNLSGDLTGSVVWSGSGDTTLSATIAANSVALGTDTTGQYASTIAISGSGITATAANSDDGTAYTIYSSASASNIASAIVLRDGSGNFSAGIITGNLTGTATTATYSYQAGYAITSGSSSTATTATYAHQAGYGITAGSANAWTTPRTLSLSGDLSGSVVWSGSGDTTLTATIVANAVALGTDTTGQYASTIAISGSGITATAANADDGTAYTIYSSATNNNTASTIVFRDGSGNFSAGIITANLTGTASTATYAHQAGYAITSGSASIATTATYSHQAGYAITSGSSSIATTATYSHQSGYGITAGSASIATTATYAQQAGYAITSGSSSIATTANYSHQAGYAVTSGSSSIATTATYSHQSGYAITSGSSNSSSIATTASNINVVSASNNIYNPVLFTPQGTGTGVAVSSYPSFSFNPTANILNVSGLAVTATTASTSTSTGALIVTGGVGIGDSLNVATAIAVNSGANGLLFQRAAGASLGAIYSTNVTPSTSNYSFATEGTNLNLNSTSNVYLNISNTVKATLSTNNFNIGINVASTSTSSGAFTVNGGVGIGGSLYTGTSTPDSISGVVLSNGFITSGSWSGSTITAYYGGTGIQAGSLVTGSLLAAGSLTTWLSINPGTTGYFLVSNGTSVLPTYQNPALLSVGLATTATYSHQSGYGITAGSAALATTATYSHQAGYAITSGTSALATTATYAHQSGYGITAGSASIATTSTYSHQSGYGITAGTSALATTATYSYQAGYAITSGSSALATTSTYSHQSGYAITAGSTGLATTSTNINVNNATTGAAHFLHFSPVATGSGVAVSSSTTLSYNPSTLIMSTPGLAVTSSTSSTSTSSGALIVTGGVGIGSSLIIGGSVGVGTNLLTSTVNITGSSNILGSTVITAPDVTNKALRVLGFSSSTQGDILSLEHPAGGSFTMNGNYAGQAGGRFTIVASGNAQVRAATFAVQASDTKTVINVDATSGAGALSLQNATNLQLFNSTNAQYAGFKYTGSATTTYTLPASAPGAGVSVLQSDTAGVMSWVAMSAGGGGSGTVTTLTAGTGITFSTGTTITTTGTIRAKRPLTVSFCAGYTPAASGADSVVIRLPDSPSDGTTSINYKPQEFHIRVETASATATTIQLEKYTGTGAFSGTAVTSVSIVGASTYENQTQVFAAAGSLLTSGDKLRINFTTLSASHANFSVYLELEEV